jgi:hypothetical protein
MVGSQSHTDVTRNADGSPWWQGGAPKYRQSRKEARNSDHGRLVLIIIPSRQCTQSVRSPLCLHVAIIITAVRALTRDL